MSCPNSVALSRALVDGIDDDLRAHLSTCPHCTDELAAHRGVADLARDLPIHEPSLDDAARVRANLLAAARTPAPAARNRLVWGLTAGAALAAAAVVLLVLGLRPSEDRPDRTVTTSRATIHPHTGAEHAVVRTGPDEIVRLSHGTITVAVAKLAPGERFRVVTGDAELEVRGTAFDVVVDRDHLRSVRVIEGRVEVRASGSAPILLSAGERWSTELTAVDPKPETETETVIDTETETETETVTETETETETETVAATADRPPSTVAADRPPSTVTADRPPSTVTADRPPSTMPDAAKPTKPSKPSTPSKLTTTTAAKPAPTIARRPIEVLFDEGWAALASGDARTAADTFHRAATSAPNDPLAEDAWFWRASALAKLKSPSAAGALDHFLSRYPRSPRAGEASAMLGWLILDRDLERAEALFRTASSDRVPSVRASAQKGLAAVAQRRDK